jgi:hypothetical protein
MADKSFFGRLQRLFSSNIIVRRVGDNEIKVVDNGRLQSSGNLNVSRYIDRFTRLHGVKPQLSTYNNNYNYYSSKTELYTDYECMDGDSIINSALDVYADETILKDEFGNILTVKSDDSRIQKILENLFFDVINVEFNLWPWVRNMCKYGDCYLKLDIEEGIGITNVTPMSSYEMVREEGADRDNPQLVQFSNMNYKGLKWENYEVAHFRLITDSNFLPYGKSILEGARKVWKQLILLEDAMIIHRIMRAPEKRIFKIDIGNIPPNEVDGYMQRIMNQMKKVPFVDDKTGDYNLKFNLQNMLEDYYLPVRGGESGTQIDTLSGMEFTGINDVEYLRNKLLAGLKIPKAFIGYEDGIGKATLAAEDVRFARTIERIQRIVISELTKIAIVHLYAQGFKGVDMLNFEITMTSPSAIYEQEKITLWNSKVDLAKSIVEGKLMSLDWIYKHIFNFSDDQIKIEKNKVIEDVKELYRKGKIENDGEDPNNMVGEKPDAESSEESDDNPFGGGDDKTKEADADDEKETTKEEGVKPKVPKGGWPGAGRPRESVKYGTNRYVAGRDPLGHEEYINSRKKSTRMESTDLYGLSRMSKSKQEIITEGTNDEPGTLLDENNLLNTEL